MLPQTYIPLLLFFVFRQQNVETLLKNMFEGEKSEVSIIHGTQVLLALLEMRKTGFVIPAYTEYSISSMHHYLWTLFYRVELMDPASQQLDQLYTVNNSILLGIQPYLKYYRHLLLNPLKVILLPSMLL